MSRDAAFVCFQCALSFDVLTSLISLFAASKKMMIATFLIFFRISHKEYFTMNQYYDAVIDYETIKAK
jgi:hypothetical protein